MKKTKLLEFFCKIPTKWLAQCKCVCKSWAAVALRPSFHHPKTLFSRNTHIPSAPRHLLSEETRHAGLRKGFQQKNVPTSTTSPKPRTTP
ncbi:hypothetical protein M0R45_020214 [Rubus argutus]|uniref:F-box domain-containing protein n=1 Tax=Rubus argutus TaxID=59490 RepID=A0AAW1XA26_RUBAR